MGEITKRKPKGNHQLLRNRTKTKWETSQEETKQKPTSGKPYRNQPKGDQAETTGNQPKANQKKTDTGIRSQHGKSLWVNKHIVFVVVAGTCFGPVAKESQTQPEILGAATNPLAVSKAVRGARFWRLPRDQLMPESGEVSSTPRCSVGILRTSGRNSWDRLLRFSEPDACNPTSQVHSQQHGSLVPPLSFLGK